MFVCTRGAQRMHMEDPGEAPGSACGAAAMAHSEVGEGRITEAAVRAVGGRRLSCLKGAETPHRV